MNITIRKIKITKLKNFKVGYNEINDKGLINAAHDTQFNNMAHPDLIDAFDLMIPHFLMLAELGDEIKHDKIMGMPAKEQLHTIRTALKHYHVSAVHISGDEDKDGIIITGQRSVHKSKSYNINTPFYTWKEIEQLSTATYIDSAIRNLTKETEQYIKGKCDNAQVDMFSKEDPAAAGKKIKKSLAKQPEQKLSEKIMEEAEEIENVEVKQPKIKKSKKK